MSYADSAGVAAFGIELVPEWGVTAPFFHHQGTLAYDFGPKHPLKPERLRRTLRLLGKVAPDLPILNSQVATIEDARRVHSREYLEALQAIDVAIQEGEADSPSVVELRQRHGLYGDNPPFSGMWDASMAYLGTVVAAAQSVKQGAPLAIAIGGGLHHAHRDRASGFCLLDDPAVACSILRDRFDRVAYVDIDVHHGDGVQWIFFDDPSVLTCSIHEEGRTLFPGTGGVEETGSGFASINVPLAAKTTADVWLSAFEQGILPAVERFDPQAIVLQLGTDTHFADPLGHILGSFEAWISAVRRVRDLGVPIVAVGGGGYNLETVPRMWVGATLALLNREIPDRLPDHVLGSLGEDWGFTGFSDLGYSHGEGRGREHAEAILEQLGREVLPFVGKTA